VGTSDLGLFIWYPDDDRVVIPQQFEGRDISSIAMESDGTILVSSGSTIYAYDDKSVSFSPVWKSQTSSNSDGKIFSMPDGCCLIRKDGQLHLRRKAGFKDIEKPSVNSLMMTDDKSGMLASIPASELLSGKKKVRFAPEYTNLDIVISIQNFLKEPFLLEYSVSGVTDGWESSFGNPEISLQNISHWRHKVEFKVTDIDSGKTSDTYSLFIKTDRRWYSSMLAIILYIIAFVVMFITLLQTFYQKQHKALEAERLRLEIEGQERLNRANIDFFANMSHEFRTPLSMILGAAKSLEKEGNPTAGQMRLDRIILRNTDRMLKIVSQILDFNKLENGKLPLSVELKDASALINDIVTLLGFGASEKEIEMRVEGTSNPMMVWFDSEKIEKVVYNIVSNAIKFTPSGGHISVKSEVVDSAQVSRIFKVPEDGLLTGGYYTVTVSDDGIGIPEDSLNLIFERFAQMESTKKTTGTGIGLYFAKSMVELHHGFIKASNDNGAVFTFAIPADESAYSEQERVGITESDEMISVDSGKYLSEYAGPGEIANREDLPKILVIDDDYEVVHFLKSILSNDYNVVSSLDAMNGYKMIETENPSVIVSDIMMLEFDGLQLCRMVKENIDMCHIPFILLTARNTVANQIEGLNVGADAYIVKPFDPDYLMAMIGSLLRNRAGIRKMLETTTSIEEKTDLPVSTRDKRFLESLYILFEKYRSNPEINIGDFASELGISRTKIFYKVKELTGMTPNDYFKIYRLNRSIDFLKENKYKIAVIAEMCGFSSPSHYALVFKKQFGATPSEYMNNV